MNPYYDLFNLVVSTLNRTASKCSCIEALWKNFKWHVTTLVAGLHSDLGAIKETCLFNDTNFRKYFTEKLIANWNKKDGAACYNFLSFIHISLWQDWVLWHILFVELIKIIFVMSVATKPTTLLLIMEDPNPQQNRCENLLTWICTLIPSVA
jgi:hypothetical protein